MAAKTRRPGPGADEAFPEGELPPRQAALRELSRPVVAGTGSREPPLVVARVLHNDPFEDFSCEVLSARHQAAGSGAAGRPDFQQAAAAYLRRCFPGLTQLPEIRFTPVAVKVAGEQSALELACARLDRAGLTRQEQELREAYRRLTALRTVFAHAAARGDACWMEFFAQRHYAPPNTNPLTGTG